MKTIRNNAKRGDAYSFWLYVFLIMPHLKPVYLERIPLWDNLFNAWRLLSFLIILIQLFLIRQKISKVCLLLVIMEIYLFCVTGLRGGEMAKVLKDGFSLLSVAFLYDALDKRVKTFLSALLFSMEVLIYINLATIILYPNGLYVSFVNYLLTTYKNYFLGYYNTHSVYYIPALVAAYLYREITGKSFRAYALTVAIFTSAILTWSGGILISLSAMTAGYLFFHFTKNRKSRILTYYTCWAIHPLFFFSIILFKIQNLFRWLIDGTLHKWYSLISRQKLWDRMLDLVSRHFIIGHGVASLLNRQIESGVNLTHAHNQFLEILYQGGLIYLILFTILVIVSGKRFYARRDTKIAQIITIGFLGWCVHTTVEPYMTPFLMGLFIMADKCDLFISAAEERREKPQYETPRQIGVYQARNLY